MALAELKRLVGGSPRRLPREVYDHALPMRNALVEVDPLEDGLRLRAPLQTQGTGFMGILARWAKMPDTKEFELEAVGAFVWDLCDGRHTTHTIARKLRERFRMNRLEAETALAAFLELLSRRRLIHLTVPDPKGSKKGCAK